jgi:hypothetical protein
MGLPIPNKHYLVSNQVSMILLYWTSECPRWTALELYKRIKLLDKNVDICFLTAVKDFNEYKVVHRDITDEIAKNDESCIIDKPADTQQLIKKINKAIGTRMRKEAIQVKAR